ncbi:helix-turn-helix domain-containing protein [Acinetobacter sp. ME22]|uniref:Cro/CI family transcriptional regulator n=1 Tax=Acinetobacter sp. ME22 TaxID=2904802 RepID=UPI001ED9D246|nr:Cro/CI family transcriptional regulator [Acinetobacter sp. ME22]MCG2572009.1 helix-turn-helix domain-containing protein [Acinetobacter sp. ME22]
MTERSNNIYQSLVNHFGGQENTAKALDVKQPAVSQWVRRTRNMSEKVAVRAEKATFGKFKAVDLCPSLKEFQDLIA